MRHAAALLVVLLCVVGSARAGSGFATYEPASVDAPVARPPVRHCSITLMRNRGFASFAPETAAYEPPHACPGPWNRVVLVLRTRVRGVQYDRIGEMWIGRDEIVRFSTAEPTKSGIEYTTEKDVTAYAPLLRSPQSIMVELGNVVNRTYTGVFYLTVRMTFYQATAHYPAPRSADVIVPVEDESGEIPANMTGRLTAHLVHLPRNIERARLEVYATNHGCDEFWYSNQSDAYAAAHKKDGLCPGGAYREIDVGVDGRIAGVVYPFPYIWTGGVNPMLWRPLSAIHTLNVPPYRVDLDPWAGVLSDGKPHRLTLTVFDDRGTWPMDGNLLLWTDRARARTGGAIVSDDIPAQPVLSSRERGDAHGGTFAFFAHRRIHVRGYVDTSRGRVWHTIDQTMHFENRQTLDLKTGRQDAVQQTSFTTTTTTQRAADRRMRRVIVSYPLDMQSVSVPAAQAKPYALVIEAAVRQGLHLRAARGRCDETVSSEATLKRLPHHVDAVARGRTVERNRCTGLFGNFDIHKASVDGTLR